MLFAISTPHSKSPVSWLPRDGDQASLLTLFLGCLCLGFDIRLPHSRQLTDTPCGVCPAVPITVGYEPSGSARLGPSTAGKMPCDTWSCRGCPGTMSSAHEGGRRCHRGGVHALAEPRYALIGLGFPQNSLLRVEL